MRPWLQAICIGLVLAVLSTRGATAQSHEAETQARAYLASGAASHTALGFHRDVTTRDLTTPLRLDHPYLWPVFMEAGVTYRVYAACDNNCSDLDMEVYAADGTLADRDNAANDTPYVQITPTESGRAYVRLWLYACRREPCVAAARVMVGGRAAPRADEARHGG